MIGEFIRELRDDRHMKLVVLSYKTELSISTIQRIEGGNDIRLQSLERLATKGFGFTTLSSFFSAYELWSKGNQLIS